ncbi:hypothetical protein CYMTET_21713 [Cymbomonas tetramitiformis]|uniref:Uncharacterized protein n=1 Tax=Cymbomonas tetramitiformis TaxID=36881 RepID=A0AAE0G1M0_9CHLO|nr:hypothetical protein CYMTET_21713 [Cymbomonas tetramitiformis]
MVSAETGAGLWEGRHPCFCLCGMRDLGRGKVEGLAVMDRAWENVVEEVESAAPLHRGGQYVLMVIARAGGLLFFDPDVRAVPGPGCSLLSSTVMVLQSRWVSRILRNMGKTTAMLTKLVSGLNVSMQLSYLGTSFMLLQFEPSLKVWSSMYFIGHITMVLGVLISMIPVGTPSSPKTPKND